MSLPRYVKYKDSGTAWLGQVPNHWEVRRLGFYFEERRQKVSDKDYPPLSVTKSGVVPQLETAAKTDDGDNRKLVCAGDFVINSRSDRKGSAGAARLDGSVSLISTVLLPTTGINIEFAHHLLRSIPFQEEFYRFGKGIVADLWSTNYSEMRNILLALPAPAEQTAIATFLDRETAKIDALIAEQEKLIALLAEKRQATISHAVTRGLNPDAPMKDSGVAWLGEVPAHWEVVKGSRIGTLFGSGPVPEDEVQEEGSVPFIKVGSLSSEGFDVANWSWYVSEATAERLTPYSEFVVFPKRGAAIFLNKVNIVKCRALIDPNLMGWKIRQNISSEYVAYLLSVRKLQELADVSTVPQINNKHIEPEKFPMPPLLEQEAIVQFLAIECHKLDLLKAEAERAVTLLKERRSALIAAAVTGQIDVRSQFSAEPAA